ncbi:unnamed protein product [Amoebophrya sp. A120]|nr:unnamed protein product [Amoebophrya sp. A120]|eukprot:GSA120T00010718001.1
MEKVNSYSSGKCDRHVISHWRRRSRSRATSTFLSTSSVVIFRCFSWFCLLRRRGRFVFTSLVECALALYSSSKPPVAAAQELSHDPYVSTPLPPTRRKRRRGYRITKHIVTYPRAGHPPPVVWAHKSVFIKGRPPKARIDSILHENYHPLAKTIAEVSKAAEEDDEDDERLRLLAGNEDHEQREHDPEEDLLPVTTGDEQGDADEIISNKRRRRRRGLPGPGISIRHADEHILHERTRPASIPIITTNFNLLHFLKLKIRNLVKNGFYNLHVIDNNSSYPPLLDYYYNSEEAAANFTLHRIYRNDGCYALWQSYGGVLTHAADIHGRRFVVSDVDVLFPEGRQWFYVFNDLLDLFPHILKVAPALKLDDLDTTKLVVTKRKSDLLDYGDHENMNTTYSRQRAPAEGLDHAEQGDPTSGNGRPYARTIGGRRSLELSSYATEDVTLRLDDQSEVAQMKTSSAAPGKNAVSFPIKPSDKQRKLVLDRELRFWLLKLDFAAASAVNGTASVPRSNEVEEGTSAITSLHEDVQKSLRPRISWNTAIEKTLRGHYDTLTREPETHTLYLHENQHVNALPSDSTSPSTTTSASTTSNTHGAVGVNSYQQQSKLFAATNEAALEPLRKHLAGLRNSRGEAKSFEYELALLRARQLNHGATWFDGHLDPKDFGTRSKTPAERQVQVEKVAAAIAANELDIYVSPVDTAAVMYQAKCSYHNPQWVRGVRHTLRVAGPKFEARHLPWYVDHARLEDFSADYRTMMSNKLTQAKGGGAYSDAFALVGNKDDQNRKNARN